MVIKVKDYPLNKDFVFVVTIDDLHPEAITDSEQLDFGSNTAKPPLAILSDTIKSIPDIKFTLFTVANWTDRSDLPNGLFFPLRKLYRRRRTYSDGTFTISDKKYATWVSSIKKFYPANIEIAYHGLHHHTYNKRFARSQEFGGLSLSQQKKRIAEMVSIFERADFQSFGFRPPGWYMDEKTLHILEDLKLLYIASPADMKTEIAETAYIKYRSFPKQNLFRPNKLGTLYNFIANCYPQQIERAVQIAKYNGIVMVHFHITKTEFGLVSITPEFPHQVSRMLQEILYQTGKTPWFATLAELSQFLTAKEHTDIREEGNHIYITNNSDYDLVGLTLEVRGITYVIQQVKAHQTCRIVLKKKVKPEISVVLTVFNGEKTIIPSLQSLAEQNFPDLEIIVVDDGSTDKTNRLVSEFIRSRKDTRLQLVTQLNKGRAAAKNKGLSIASGEIITFCEDDAIYSREYITEAIKHFKNEKTLGVIGPHYVWNRNDSWITRAKDLERRRNFTNYKPFSVWFYKRDDLYNIGGFNEDLPFGEDIEPMVRLKKKHPHKRIVFEARSIWLHREPSSWMKYLKRKYKGGLGLALLSKMGIQKALFPPQILLVGVFLFIVYVVLLYVVYILFHALFLFISLLTLFLGIILMIILRAPDLKKTWYISNESHPFMVASIFVEYTWWVATLFGYIVGVLVSEDKIRSFLKGR